VPNVKTQRRLLLLDQTEDGHAGGAANARDVAALFVRMRVGARRAQRVPDHGVVVLVSSRTAKEGRVGQCAYAVAKEGVAPLAEVIAEECCGSGVTANVIAPSVLDTPANRRAVPSADFTRWVSPDVAAAMVAFLVSDEAGTLRGAWLPVFGSV
jgi:NAD(P)-dependent dehydrogenase (short-subunit alcohol dehydrogenase family)